MRCPACAHENPQEAYFCSQCGVSLQPASSDRLKSLRAFIPSEVADKIIAAGGIGERRIVTVMSCDIVGSTQLGERLGPERFKVVMDQVLGRAIAAVARYEGTVAQVSGDGLLAFFGAPLAHEDDAERRRGRPSTSGMSWPPTRPTLKLRTGSRS
ncbi:MAG TPA: zinc-ribbon domain-containing protein [Thermoleophilia bacterium]|nr:zinc-ribbon domain-containing protein [Thermoleophilia bacterium]